ncbi:MAG TPA: ribonuclease P protein component [Actinomycetes bacterium]|nr:ribonuclease P protein component [Actinomycetes bacterium]
MLPAAHRMRRRADFTAAVRAGRRASSSSLVLHIVPRPDRDDPAKVGLIVSKGVGGSVVRHQVARRLRAVCAGSLDRFADGDLVVIRALPQAAMASSAELADDLEHAAERLGRRAESPVESVATGSK